MEYLPFCQVFPLKKELMTQKELAERLNVDTKTLRNWETSKPELIKLIQLGLATEQHVKDVEKYLDEVKKISEK